MITFAEKQVWSTPTQKGIKPLERHGHSLTNLGEGRVLLFGGACEDEETGRVRRMNDCYILDTSTLHSIACSTFITMSLPFGR